MSVKTISPEEARRLMGEGATLIDVREADEHTRLHIPGARSLPMSAIEAGRGDDAPRGPVMIYHCQTGTRTLAGAERLPKPTDCEVYILDGGLEAWRSAGLPVREDRSQPLPLMRQVQIAAGGLVVLGVVLGYALSPWFFLLSGFVGAGLMQAGITGWCGMAKLFARMPWNRERGASPQAAVRG